MTLPCILSEPFADDEEDVTYFPDSSSDSESSDSSSDEDAL